MHVKNLKQELNHGLVLKIFHEVLKFNQNAWLKPYIDMKTDLKKKQKMISKNIFLSWWIIQILEKIIVSLYT